jgi:hypothetical protein
MCYTGIVVARIRYTGIESVIPNNGEYNAVRYTRRYTTKRRPQMK